MKKKTFAQGRVFGAADWRMRRAMRRPKIADARQLSRYLTNARRSGWLAPTREFREFCQ